MQKRMDTQVLVEGAIFAALAMALSYIPLGDDTLFNISLGQIPLTIYALRRGTKPGLLAAFLWGMLHFLGKAWFLNVVQVIVEYPIAFTFAGFAGLVSSQLHQAIRENKNLKARLLILEGSLIGAITRYFWHFVAGVAFWASYAKWGLSPWVYSLVINGVSGVLTGVLATAAVLVVFQLHPTFFLPKELRKYSAINNK